MAPAGTAQIGPWLPPGGVLSEGEPVVPLPGAPEDACAACTAWPGTLEALVGWQHFHDGAPACWWFVRETYWRHLGIALPYENVLLPRREWGRLIDAAAGKWVPVTDPRPYDVVLIQRCRTVRVDHIGLYAGDDRVLHVPTRRAGVCRNRIGYFSEHDCTVQVYRRA